MKTKTLTRKEAIELLVKIDREEFEQFTDEELALQLEVYFPDELIEIVDSWN